MLHIMFTGGILLVGKSGKKAHFFNYVKNQNFILSLELFGGQQCLKVKTK